MPFRPVEFDGLTVAPKCIAGQEEAARERIATARGHRSG